MVPFYFITHTRPHFFITQGQLHPELPDNFIFTVLKNYVQ